MKYVVAGSKAEFDWWMWENKIPKEDARYVTNLGSLMGKRGTYTDVVFTGTWFERKDRQEIANYVSIRFPKER